MPFGLSDKNHEDIQNVFTLFPKIEEVIVFGSRAMGTNKPGSDIDLALKGKKITNDAILKISGRLTDLGLLYKYDILSYDAIKSKALIKHIDKHGISFYKKQQVPSKWKTYKLDEACTKIGSGATPRGGQESYVSKGISLIRSQNVLDFSFSKNGLAFITELQANELSNVVVEQNDVLLNITGDSVARVCQVPLDVLPARVNQHVAILRPTKNKLVAEYLKYYLLSPSQKQKLLSLASAGATRNALTKGMIEQYEIQAPEDPSEQSRIATILSSLDNKIELNLQMNQTLENMAQAIFKEWFVNFNFPGFDGKLVNGIPKGWVKKTFGELLESHVGGDWGKEEVNEEFPVNVAIVRGTDFNDLLKGAETRIPIRFIKQTNFEKKKVTSGDILLEISGGTKDQPTGRTILFSDELLKQFRVPIVPASFCRLMRPKSMNYSLFLDSFMNWFYSIGGTWEYQNQSTGISNFQFTYFIENKTITLPKDDSLVKDFGKIIHPLKKKIHENLNEIKTLSEVRDSLLPKLMSGKIKVPA